MGQSFEFRTFAYEAEDLDMDSVGQCLNGILTVDQDDIT